MRVVVRAAILPAVIRQLSGNLGVDRLLHARAGAPAPAADATERAIERLAALGVDGVEEYLGWALVEPARDRFDWSAAHQTARLARARGLRYVVYPWLHVVPDWFLASSEFVPMRCLEHGGTIGWPSPFAPTTRAAFRRFHASLRDALGDKLDALCLAFPADYGEIGFPSGFGAWAAPPRAPHDHLHAGFWFGDPHARAAWSPFAAERGLAADLDRAVLDPGARAALARFGVAAVVAFVDGVLADLRALFPQLPLWLKVGHGGENAEYGIDVTALARVAARHGAGLRTTQATLPTLHQQRIATACSRFSVALASEPPLDVGRARAVGRLFDDAVSGAVEVFEYPEQLVAARDLRARFGALRRGVAAATDVAVHFSRTALLAQPHVGFPPRLYELADALRDRADYAVVDGEQIGAGGLDGIRLLAMPDGVAALATQRELLRFVHGGGTLLIAPAATLAPGPLADAVATTPLADGAVALASGAIDGAPAALRVAFGTAGEAEWLAGEWHAPEDAAQFQETAPRGVKARWSGRGAAVVVPRDLAGGAGATLLELEAWVHPGFAPQRVAIRVDGAVVGALERTGLQRFAAWLPPPAAASVSTIELDAELRVPARLGLGADRRELGVALIWLRLTAEGASAAHALAIERWPPNARVDPVALRERVGRVGAGGIVRCGAAPFARFLGLFEHLVATTTEWGATAPRSAEHGARALDVRLARFLPADGEAGGRSRWLAWNRAAAPAKLVRPGSPAAAPSAAVGVPPGWLAELP